MLYTFIGVNLTRLIYPGADLTRVLFRRGSIWLEYFFLGTDLILADLVKGRIVYDSIDPIYQVGTYMKFFNILNCSVHTDCSIDEMLSKSLLKTWNWFFVGSGLTQCPSDLVVWYGRQLDV